MRELKLLRKRVKAMWKMEEELSPPERKLHQWQFLSTQTGIPYLVGKGDANTFFYKIGEKGEMQYVMPDKMFAILDKWCGEKYVMYAIARNSNVKKAKRQSKVLADLLKRTHSKYADYHIVGITADSRVDKLYSMKTGLTANQWVPLKVKP